MASLLSFLPVENELDELNVSILTVVADYLMQVHCPAPEQSARDLVAALRGIIDATGLAGESDQAALYVRVKKTRHRIFAARSESHAAAQSTSPSSL